MLLCTCIRGTQQDGHSDRWLQLQRVAARGKNTGIAIHSQAASEIADGHCIYKEGCARGAVTLWALRGGRSSLGAGS